MFRAATITTDRIEQSTVRWEVAGAGVLVGVLLTVTMMVLMCVSPGADGAPFWTTLAGVLCAGMLSAAKSVVAALALGIVHGVVLTAYMGIRMALRWIAHTWARTALCRTVFHWRGQFPGLWNAALQLASVPHSCVTAPRGQLLT